MFSDWGNRYHFYKDNLFNDTLAFWKKYGIDHKNGGYFSGIGQYGELIDSDKSLWFQGRFSWVLSRVYNDFDQNSSWLELAKSGVDFILAHGFDKDGRMFYRTTADGRPLVKRRYLFTEAFAVIALAAFGRASGEYSYVEKAKILFEYILEKRVNPDPNSSKFISEHRNSSGLALPMILLSTAQELRVADNHNPIYTKYIDQFIAEIRRFLDYERSCILETLEDGRFSNHFEGRLLNPGHGIEAAWFILRESQERGGDNDLIQLGCQILDWMWQWGWDTTCGGIIYYRDALNYPASEYWHDMKFWWPQCEAIIANLMAYSLTKETTYLEKYEQVHNWTHAHFPDQEGGEWFGYLHRDGTVSSTIKGNMFKGPFHIPRMQMYGMELCKKLEKHG